MAKQRLLITGPMRSGTTLIQREIVGKILKQPWRPEITPLSEVLALAARFRSGYEETRHNIWIEPTGIADALIETALIRFMPLDDCDGWQVGKCPYLVKYANEIERLVRLEVKCVVVVRDPLDVIASAMEVADRSPTTGSRDAFVNEVKEMFAGLEQLLKLASSNRRDFYIVHYEKFVMNDAQELSRMGQWLGETGPYEKKLKLAEEFDAGNPFVTDLFFQPTSDLNVGSFRYRLSAGALGGFEEVFSGVRRRLGYCS